ERVGMRASERRNRLRKPAAIRATLSPDPSPAERVRGDYGIGSNCQSRPSPPDSQPECHHTPGL
ncbi:MAG TPA: hypothetical protein PLD05_09465, partial [Thermogutta sp.]|nr:hypothetical protein [Thermogutta sp.]